MRKAGAVSGAFIEEGKMKQRPPGTGNGAVVARAAERLPPMNLRTSDHCKPKLELIATYSFALCTACARCTATVLL